MNTYPDFLVRIGCITYNHAPYIEDAMNGFCMQQTTFPFVATIIDDASTDGEPEVIRNYLDVHFDLSEEGLSRQWETDDAYFIYAQHKENKNCYFAVVLLKYNFYSIKKSKVPLIKDWIETKYIALCEGDDYWITPHKLQKQIDFLEKNPDYTMCFHSVYYDEEGSKNRNDRKCNSNRDYTTEDIIIGGGLFCGTCSLLFERNILEKPYGFRKMADVGDYPLQIICSLGGKIHYFSEIMGCYRISTPNSWTRNTYSHRDILSRHIRNEISWLLELNNETECKYQDAIFYRIAIFCSFYLNDHFVTKQEFVSYLKKVHIWNLNKDNKISYINFVLEHSYPRLFRLKEKRDFASFVYLLSPVLYDKYIKWRLRTIKINQK